MNSITYINDLPEQAIFYSLYSLPVEIPWNKQEISASLLDLMYKWHSGLKKLHYPISKALSEDKNNFEILATALWAMYRNKWERTYNSLLKEYDAIADTDYNISENSINTEDRNYSIDKNQDVKTLNTENNNLYEDEIKKNSNIKNENTNGNESSKSSNVASSVNNDKYFGFNSSSDNPVDTNLNLNSDNNTESTRTVNDNRTKSQENSEAINTNKKIEEKNQSNNINDYTKENKHENVTNNIQYNHLRKGRDGQHTPQEMLEQELEFIKHKFFDIVFDNIDEFITIPCY